jgi:hypothetical protein
LPFSLHDQSVDRDSKGRKVLLDDVPRRRHVGALLFMSQQVA